MNLSREFLLNRHRLSHRQIDDWLGEPDLRENREHRLRAMQQIGSFLAIAKLLNAEGIWFINLKGPLLSHRIYGDPTYRSFRDFDILVKPNDVSRVLYLLRENGYQSTGFAWPRSEEKQRITLHFLNQVEMVHEEAGVMMEIHWKLFSARIAKDETIRLLLQENTETIEFGGQQLNRLSLEFELFYLIVHGGIHAWFRLKWLVDIHEILSRKQIDWESFHTIIKKSNARRLVEICNTMLGEFFPAGKQLVQPSEISAGLGPVAIEQCKQPEGDPHITRLNTLKLLIYRIKLFPRWQYKADVMKVITFCKTDLKYNWLPSHSFVYYLFRPVGYVLRGLKVLK